NVDETILELDAEENESSNVDMLTKGLSDLAFKEDSPLPSIDKDDDKGFIDIDVLLEDTDNKSDITEDEFNLEFGLDEFPDVVDPFSEFDSDEDGIAAQLDLARAYLEIDEKEGASEILTSLLDKATDDKLKEVQKLLDRIK
ncbi:hypothetical protein N8878_00695, partial [Psychromonas sp.]|nr:hypothetical protein [Psychromonas sp.]